ncbi:acetyl-CoA synthetase-like protein [Tilletiaria anomala UBC 951]|uniref:Acetyl-CoA synthetase-like protein n=1 Tax=Tilletiaria anomala (strain ATCC 24038 / CBS 436.72 / UBC 951) TaxID=1037660 RepID=A0A066WBP3_TILAU|nr:acetyl-CoA synthetase-like protein [Tilletiaria anomala UBC 951]KDN48514.1 acetyl-CoA synthetase-like protein [Tilletiaria anomala UBC 951]
MPHVITTSPHKDIDVPDCTLPQLLLIPSFSKAASDRLSQPIFHPSPIAPRVLATRNGKDAPLSHLQIRSIAERVAVSLLSSAYHHGAAVVQPKWQKGYVVAFFSTNQHDYCAAVLGVQMAGGIAALCNPSCTPRELAHQLRMTKACIIIAADETFDSASEAAKLASSKMDPSEEPLEEIVQPQIFAFDESHHASWADTLLTPPKSAWARKEKLLGQVDINPYKDPATYCFSSGTSGLPKALALTHRNLVANVLQFRVLMDDQFEQHMSSSSPSSPPASQFHIDILPTSHAYGLLAQLVALYTGTPRVVLARFKLDLFLQVAQDKKVTFVFVVPPVLLALAKSPEVDKYNLTSLRRVASGAASLPHELARQVKQRLNIDVTDGYGMSEMSPIVCLQNVKDAAEAPGSVGFLAPNTKARILGPDGQDVGPDQEGELLLQGPQMMAGYVHNDEGNRAAFTSNRDDPDCWLRTGDMAKVSEQGHITLTGRTKDIIKVNGFQVSPRELEDLLFKQPSVADAAVVGATDDQGTEIPWAFLVASKDAAEVPEKERSEAITKAINGHVAGYKRIKGITWVDALPKSNSGKVLKRLLKTPA